MLVRSGTGGEAQPMFATGGSGAGGYVTGRDRAQRASLPRPATSDDRGGRIRPRNAESVADKRAEARMKGYVGESCPECGNFTMVRNGTCLKCDTCGGTTGCS